MEYNCLPKKLKCKRGQELFLQLIEGDSYEGKFHSQNEDSGRLTLYDVKYIDTGTKFTSLYYFSTNEVRYLKIINNSVEHEINKTCPQQLKIENKENGIENKEVKTKENIENKEAENKSEIPACELFRLSEMARNYKVLTKLDDRYFEAIDHLGVSEIIGVDGKGADFGRKMELSILILSTWHQAYVFDIKKMGKSFDKGIKNILESKSILKVVHNGDKLSDCLMHQHNTYLRNVFDTSVADKHLMKRKGIDLLPKSRKLADIVQEYFGVPNLIDSVNPSVVKWNHRPLCDVLKKKVTDNCIYLISLSNFMKKEMNNTFYKAVDFYMDSIRDADSGDAHYKLTRLNKLPDGFKELLSLNKSSSEVDK